MADTITIEIPATSEALVRRLLSLHEELQALALSAPDGTVLDACETAVIDKGRGMAVHLLCPVSLSNFTCCSMNWSISSAT